MFLRQLRDIRGLGGSKLNHPDLQQARINNDEADIQALMDLMENTWINPLRHDQDDLVNYKKCNSSGNHAKIFDLHH